MQAQFGLALAYDLGRCMPRDPAAAYRWYRRAAEAGVPEAQFNVAAMHDTGDGVPRDVTLAGLWYGRAAAHGNRRAQYNLALLYAQGEGVARNLEAAKAWYRAAAAGIPAAARKLALLKRFRPTPSSPGPGTDGVPMSVQPVYPSAADRLERTGPSASIELVWNAPPQAVVVRYFVEVVALGSEGQSEAFSAYVEESAVLARLPAVPGRFAWRVYTIGGLPARYVASGWTHFAVEHPD